MTPVTTGVANGKKNNLLLFLGLLECSRPPGIPVNRVVSVHQQVRTSLLRQQVCIFFRFLFCRIGLGAGRRKTACQDADRDDQQEAENIVGGFPAVDDPFS